MDSLSIRKAARERPDSTALVFRRRTLSYRELSERAIAAADRLVRLGASPAAPVALALPNRPESLVTVAALLELGVSFVPLHTRFTPAERAELVAQSGASLVLDEAQLEALAAPGEGAAVADVVDPDLPALVMFTSGTSGRPKGAVLQRRALMASANSSEQNLGWRPEERWVLTLPLTHIGGLSIFTRCLRARKPLLLCERFDAAEVLDLIERQGATLLSAVPTTLRALLSADRAGALSRLRGVLLGGAAAPQGLIDECVARGVPALTTYGLTEACSQVSSQSPGATGEPGNGRPLPGAQVSVVGEDGRELLAEEVGRIRVRGPMLMRGYLGRAPLDGGWFDTGDLGALDFSGRLHLRGRRSDLIVTGGENVYPLEIERVLQTCSEIEQALVFGVDDETWGQLVAAAVVLSPGAEPAEARLAEELAAKLASFKLPRRLCYVPALPVLSNGKPDRAGAARILGGLLRSFGYPARAGSGRP